eukprot:GHVS01090679.1.p1 GENE.GHVS01090679.1~~GHVS01090679.1.p1  ORF type:complete len:572 (-),score=149.77 GHVS01090679.1:431-1951(-)
MAVPQHSILSTPSSPATSYPYGSMEEPREQLFSTLAGNDEEEDHLLSFDYNSLPTYPLRPAYNYYSPPTQQRGTDEETSPSSSLVFAPSLPPSLQSFSTHINSFNPPSSSADPYRPAAVPIYQTATFHQPNIETFGPYDYSRSGNPTRTAVETLVASLDLAHAAFAFGSGMAAMTAVTRLVGAGEEIVCGDDIYGGMFRLLTKVVNRQGIVSRFCDVSNLSLVKSTITEMTKMIWVESPSNPLMRISDIRALSRLAHSHNILLVVDSTMMTPCLMRPLCLGADIVIHSATKFFSGHSDTMAGFVCCSTEQLSRDVSFVQNAEGGGLSPFDCWLVYRGLKTLPLRLERAQSNAHCIAQFLSAHPLVQRLYYAGHRHQSNQSKGSSDDDLQIHQRQARGGGSVMSFETGSVGLSRRICDACRLFKITVSFGSCSSLIEMPCVLSHASIPKEMRRLPENLIRLSVGVEDIDDLLADLCHAMKEALASYQLHQQHQQQHDHHLASSQQKQ